MFGQVPTVPTVPYYMNSDSPDKTIESDADPSKIKNTTSDIATMHINHTPEDRSTENGI